MGPTLGSPWTSRENLFPVVHNDPGSMILNALEPGIRREITYIALKARAIVHQSGTALVSQALRPFVWWES